MSRSKNTQRKIKPSRYFLNMNNSELVGFAHGIKFTSDPGAAIPDNTVDAVRLLADEMINTRSYEQIDTSKTAPSSETREHAALVQALGENALSLGVIAKRVAKAKGNYTCQI